MLEADRIRELLGKVSASVNWNAVGLEDSLEEAGLDSLDKASFFLEVETETGVRIPDEAYEKIDSIEGVQEALRERA